jgi:Rieske Fe-S protein
MTRSQHIHQFPISMNTSSPQEPREELFERLGHAATNAANATHSHSRRSFLKTALTASALVGTGIAATSISNQILLADTLADKTNDSANDASNDKGGSGKTAAVFSITLTQYPKLRTVFGSESVGVPGTFSAIFVTRISATEFVSTSGTCTHSGCGVNPFDASSRRFVCPCHGSTFDAAGKRLSGVARSDMSSYPTTFNAATETIEINHPSAVLTSVATRSANATNDVPLQNLLGQCFPNPAVTTVTIEYAVAKAGHVTIALYSMLGKEVGRIVDKHHEAGQHRTSYDVSTYAQGVYLYRMTTNGFSQTRKLTIAQ